MVVFEEFLLRLGLDATLAADIASAIRFIVTLLVLIYLGRTFALPLAKRVLESRNLELHIRRPLLKVVWGGVLFGAFVIAFSVAGYDNFLTSLTYIAAAVTLAVGLATQTVLSNFIAGVLIFLERPFRIGDWIEWDGSNYSGVVEDISLRSTQIRTFDNELITVPNMDLANNVVKNPVAGEKLRLKFVFGVSYDDDIMHARDVILEEAADHPDILNDPKPEVHLTGLGDSDVRLETRFWIEEPSRADFIRIRSQYVTAVKERFDHEGISIPYPHRVLGGNLTTETVQTSRTTHHSSSSTN